MSDIEKFGMDVEGEDELYNVFPDLKAMIEEIAPTLPFSLGDKNLRSGKPGQFIMKLELMMEDIDPDKQNRLKWLAEFISAERSAFDALGRDAYLDGRGVAKMSAIDEYFQTGDLPRRQTLSGALESGLTEFARQRQREIKVKSSLSDFEERLHRDEKAVAQEISLWRRGLNTFQDSIRRLQEKIGVGKDIFQQAKIQIQREEAKRQALAINLAPRLKKASKKIASKPAQTKYKNLIESDSGKDAMSDFIHTATMISMATRRSMGMRITGLPRKEDFHIAKRMAERLIESGSMSKRNINIFLRQVRVESEDWTLKHSKSKNLKSKAPSFSKVREEMHDMGMSFEEMEQRINSSKNKSAISRTIKKATEAGQSNSSKLQKLKVKADNISKKKSDADLRRINDEKFKADIVRTRERNKQARKSHENSLGNKNENLEDPDDSPKKQ